jgi:hypothetical protein
MGVNNNFVYWAESMKQNYAGVLLFVEYFLLENMRILLIDFLLYQIKQSSCD